VIGLGQRETLLDPTGDGDGSADTRLAPRLRSLSGLRGGLLDNTKPNSSVLLAASQLRVIVANCDFVVAGIGD
jgi:hypothetical protein